MFYVYCVPVMPVLIQFAYIQCFKHDAVYGGIRCATFVLGTFDVTAQKAVNK